MFAVGLRKGALETVDFFALRVDGSVVDSRRSLLFVAEVIAVSDLRYSGRECLFDWFEGRSAVVVCVVHDVRIPSTIVAQPKVRRSEYHFIDLARFKVLARSLVSRPNGSASEIKSKP
jgi:hypothetical protein